MENKMHFFAYTETQGTYRVPHNHGNGWVIYHVLSGEMEMGNFTQEDSKAVLRNKELLKAGDSRLYEVGEIHDTRCLSEIAIIIRFTSCDLNIEQQEGRMLRFKEDV
jgi:hypothetical protein